MILLLSRTKVAVIKIKERICLPRFLIGRWDIRVSLAYKGLMWVGGAQVDPGFKGNLHCPIYNLSNKPVHLQPDQELAVIDFVKTTRFNENERYTKKFDTEEKADRDFFGFNAEELESALLKQADSIKDVQAQAKSVDTRMTWFITIVVSLLGLLGVSKILPPDKFPSLEWYFIGGVFLMVFLIIKIVASFTLPSTAAGLRWAMRALRLSPKAYFRFRLFWSTCLGVITIVVVTGSLYFIVSDPFGKLKKMTKDVDRRVNQIETMLDRIQKEKQ